MSLRERARYYTSLFAAGALPPPQPWEWLEVCPHPPRAPFLASGQERATGWVPRWVAESIGVNCSVLDRNRERPAWEHGAVFFTREQSEQLRQSKYWRAELPGGDPS